jgi:heme/copper-type cytochrome/quinol oxidase subunit 1
MLLPFPPFTELLRILVGGGPGVWFLMAYLLFLAVGFGGFTGFSYIYYTLEAVEGRHINPLLARSHLVLMYLGVLGAVLVLAVAGVLGGYSTTIAHAPPEVTRQVLEPFVWPIRLLAILALVGIGLGLAAIKTAST